jgi:hypothetical protein
MINNLVRYSLVLFSLLLSLPSTANESSTWSVLASNGIMATSSGTLAINIGSVKEPVSLSPSKKWEPCASNWIYFHKALDGSNPSVKQLNRMLSIALAAQKTGNRIKVEIMRSSTNRCYTSEISDLGY